MLNHVRRALSSEPVSAASVAAFRVAFGVVLFVSTVRFVAKGFVAQLYIEPQLLFPYWGWRWIERLPGQWMYAPFALMAIAALYIAAGHAYRCACGVFLVAFTYVELLDQTTYLNHYYFVSCMLALMVLLPLDRGWVWRRDAAQSIPRHAVTALRVQVAVVYIFAGIAKLRADWLLAAMPLRLWLPMHSDLPVIGPLMDEVWVAYLASWGGAAFDLMIVPLLLCRRTRRPAMVAVVAFHLATGLLFRIGVFPLVMVAAATLLLPPDWAKARLPRTSSLAPSAPEQEPAPKTKMAAAVYALLLVQLVLPLRRVFYPGNTAWTEEGFRFSWQVMLVEKAGDATFRVVADGVERRVSPTGDLVPHQRRFVPTQPELILQYAHLLRDRALRDGATHVQVFADVFVAFNGRRSQRLIDGGVDLAREEEGLAPKPWVLALATADSPDPPDRAPR